MSNLTNLLDFIVHRKRTFFKKNLMKQKFSITNLSLKVRQYFKNLVSILEAVYMRKMIPPR